VYDRPCSLAEIWDGERFMPHINVPMDEKAAASLYHPSPARRVEKENGSDMKTEDVTTQSKSDKGETPAYKTAAHQVDPMTENHESEYKEEKNNVSD